MAKLRLPAPVNETEATLRNFLYGDLVLTVLMVFFRIYFLNSPIDADPSLMGIVTMFLVIVPGAMAILMAALIQHVRAKSKQG